MTNNENSAMEQNESKIEKFTSSKEAIIKVSAEKLWNILGPDFAEHE